MLGWTGRVVLMWIDGCCENPSDQQAASYNPRSNAWKLLPAAPLRRWFGPEGTWTGKELVAADGTRQTSRSISFFRTGAAYRPAARR